MGDDHAIRFGEKVIALIDSGRKSTTYKLATVLALLDVTAAGTSVDGEAPASLSGLDVADRVLELYWPQTTPWSNEAGTATVLRQSPQNDIPSKLATFRSRWGVTSRASITDAEEAAPAEWAALRDELRAIVLGMPLAKLQRFGDGRMAREERFIYDYSWKEELSVAAIRRPGFDDTLHLRPDVGRWLIQLGPLLRPLAHARWTHLIARQNRDILQSHQLDEFLFGALRIALDRVREPLIAAQRGQCFYCEGSLHRAVEVDHFLPWSRHPENALDNLVATHRACNNAKSASIASLDHLGRWLSRCSDPGLDLIAATSTWPRNRTRTESVVRATYLWLPSGAPLWVERNIYEPLDRSRTLELLAA